MAVRCFRPSCLLCSRAACDLLTQCNTVEPWKRIGAFLSAYEKERGYDPCLALGTGDKETGFRLAFAALFQAPTIFGITALPMWKS